VCSNVIISLIRKIIPDQIRIACYIVVIAGFVTMVEIIMKGIAPEAVNQALGIFIPLIVVNCLIIGRAEAFASRNNVIHSLVDAIAMGIGFTMALTTLGAIREMIGFGTLFSQAHLMFGESAKVLTITFFDNYPNMLIAILPPGAFLCLGLMIAGKNVLNARAAKRAALAVAAPMDSGAQTAN